MLNEVSKDVEIKGGYSPGKEYKYVLKMERGEEDLQQELIEGSLRENIPGLKGKRRLISGARGGGFRIIYLGPIQQFK